MNILIIEDEAPAARRLAGLVQTARPNSNLLGPLDSIESAVDFFEKEKNRTSFSWTSSSRTG